MQLARVIGDVVVTHKDKNLAGITGADQTGFEADEELDEFAAGEPELAATA